jgi:hypothetical protein
LVEPGHRRGKCRTAASPKLFTFREAGMQVSPVTMSHPSLRTTAPPCLPLDIKDSLKEDTRLLLLGFLLQRLFALGAFALRLLLLPFGFGLLAFWCGRFLEGKKIAEGKRIGEKENC